MFDFERSLKILREEVYRAMSGSYHTQLKDVLKTSPIFNLENQFTDDQLRRYFNLLDSFRHLNEKIIERFFERVARETAYTEKVRPYVRNDVIELQDPQILGSATQDEPEEIFMMELDDVNPSPRMEGQPQNKQPVTAAGDSYNHRHFYSQARDQPLLFSRSNSGQVQDDAGSRESRTMVRNRPIPPLSI